MALRCVECGRLALYKCPEHPYMGLADDDGPYNDEDIYEEDA